MSSFEDFADIMVIVMRVIVYITLDRISYQGMIYSVILNTFSVSSSNTDLKNVIKKKKVFKVKIRYTLSDTYPLRDCQRCKVSFMLKIETAFAMLLKSNMLQLFSPSRNK